MPYGFVALTDGTLTATFMEPASNSLLVALNAVGNTDGATWKVTSGSLPQGLSLDVSSGALVGTPPQVTAPTSVKVQVTSVSGMVATANLSVQVSMRATVFDGTSNFVTLPDVATTFGGGASFTGFTLAAWVDVTQNGCYGSLFDLSASNNYTNTIRFGRNCDSGYALANNFSDDSLYSGIWGPNGFNGVENHTKDGALPLNAWHYVAMTQSGNVETIYVDGVAQITFNQDPPVVASRPYSFLGRSSSNNRPLFGGQMADVQVYDRALSAAELGTTQSGNTLPGLVARYLTGHSQATDLSGVAGNAAPSGIFATVPFTVPNVGNFNLAAALTSDNGMCDYSLAQTSDLLYPCSETMDDLLRGNLHDPYATNAVYGYSNLPDLKVGDSVGPDSPKFVGTFVNPKFAIFPALPAGLTFSANGTISGTLVSPEPKTTVHVVTVTDDRGVSVKTEVSMSYMGVAQFADAIRNYNFDTNGIDEMASDILHAGGDLPSGTTWQVASGSLPPGVKMDATGHITGGVVHVGIYPVTLTAMSNGAVVGSGTIKYFVTYVAGVFDGDSFIRLPSNTASTFFDANGSFTGYAIAAWVKFADTRPWEDLWDFAADGNGYDNMYLNRNGGDTTFLAQSTTGSIKGGNIVPGTWTHVAMVMAPSGMLSLYQDGKVVARAQEGVPNNVDRPFSFLGRSIFSDPKFAGQMADVQIYGNPISQSQVQRIMQGDRGTDIRAWYLIGIYTDYDATMAFGAQGAHAAVVNGNVGQALFMPPLAPGN